jgi:hypothetical protein
MSPLIAHYQKLGKRFDEAPKWKGALMQTDRSHRFAALALGTTAIFDVTGAVIYRVLRRAFRRRRHLTRAAGLSSRPPGNCAMPITRRSRAPGARTA